MKIGLGTAQFGFPYGISNFSGEVQQNEIEKIFDLCRASGIKVIDTASSYGRSEQKLGQSSQSLDQFKVISKFLQNSEDAFSGTAKQLIDSHQRSLELLGVSTLYAYLIHDVKALFDDRSEELYGALRRLKENGLTEKIGVSVYNEHEIKDVLSNYDVDLIQLPVNIFDQRLLQTDILHQLKKRSVEIHARSCFLQGLCFLEPEKLPSYLEAAKPPLKSLRDYARQNGKSILSIMIGFVSQIVEVDSIILGVTSAQQLQEILTAESSSKDMLLSEQFLDLVRINEEQILNPSSWNQNTATRT